MQKEFKHKKTGEIATYQDGVLKSSGFCVEIGVEPSSEFWEEVVEKNYEILSFKANKDILSIPKHTILTKECSGDFVNYNACDVTIRATENNLLKNNDWDIYSVKRLSDSEIFTIGDTVQLISANWKDTNCKISKIIVVNNNVVFTIKQNLAEYTYYHGIHDWRKAKPKPILFTTEDGVDIFKGDEIHFVDCYFKYQGKYIASENTLKLFPNRRIFSTKEAAENYIICNKPCLSFNDVWNISNNKSSDNHYVIIDKRQLKELVKSKL
jgi:hypothetical protein